MAKTIKEYETIYFSDDAGKDDIKNSIYMIKQIYTAPNIDDVVT